MHILVALFHHLYHPYHFLSCYDRSHMDQAPAFSPLHLFRSQFAQFSSPSIITKRHELFRLLNGDSFYPISCWPRNIQSMFWKKSVVDVESFKLIHRRTGTFGLGGSGDFLARKNYAMPESVRVEIGMPTQTFTIFASNETAIIGKIVKLKACILS